MYDANAAQAWLAVDAGVDEATFRALFSEAITDRSVPRDESPRRLPEDLPQPENDSVAAMAEISQAIAADILTLPELSDPDWDTYSMVAEVRTTSVHHDGVPVHRVGTTSANRGTDEQLSCSWDLRDKTRGTNGEAWDVVLVKIHRDTAQLVVNFVRGESADMWRINPQNMDHLPESLRPRPEDFQPIDETEDIVERFQALVEGENRQAGRLPAEPAHSEIPLLPVQCIGTRTATASSATG